MNERPPNRWVEDNQRYFSLALGQVRRKLRERCITLQKDVPPEKEELNARPLPEIAATMTAPPSLDNICRTFGLTTFERQVLLLCAGVELDSSLAALCSSAQGDGRRAYATFGLALAIFSDAHWSALNPAAPLRFWRLIEMDKAESLTTTPLRIDERILHYLMGVFHLDERLWGLVRPWPSPGNLVPSHQGIADRIVMAWSYVKDTGGWPAIQLSGKERNSKRNIASAVCRHMGLELCLLSAQTLPANPADLEGTLRLWSREAALSSSALLIEYDETDTIDPTRISLLQDVIDMVRGAVLISGRRRLGLGERFGLHFEVAKPTLDEQRDLWESLREKVDMSPDGWVDAVTAQFNFEPQMIWAAGAEALGAIHREDLGRQVKELVGVSIWNACRRQARPRLEDLAMRTESAVTWEDLVLPPLQVQTLKTISAHLRQRVRVYGHWGFSSKSRRGLGISALFAGESGTGKTLAAEVLANELRLDLYRIDLSQVVSKYIGETEKNLRRIFDAAEDGGAILLFDEADALFGKRSEVKDSHDRYANIEVSYLLQQMDVHRGLAILTSNMKSALDPAFLRRIRFVIQFPFPDAKQRAEIWRRIFPQSTPIEGLDFEKLARLNIAGGNIRNIALNGAFLAADKGQSVSMSHLLHAARAEYAKMEKPLTEGEIRGWA